MMQQLVVTAHGLIVLQWRVTIKTSAPNRIHVTLAGKYRIITKETNSFFMLAEGHLPEYFEVHLRKNYEYLFSSANIIS